MKLNDVWQPALARDLIRRAKEMKEELKADGLQICERDMVSEHLNLFVWVCIVCLLPHFVNVLLFILSL